MIGHQLLTSHHNIELCDQGSEPNIPCNAFSGTSIIDIILIHMRVKHTIELKGIRLSRVIDLTREELLGLQELNRRVIERFLNLESG